jgi:hypothetical protein
VHAGIATFTDEEEAGLHAVIVEARVVEITEHRLVVAAWRAAAMGAGGGGGKKKDAKQPYAR